MTRPGLAPATAPPLIVVDGHDGSGKTTLAQLLARALGGVVVRPFVGPIADAFYRCLEAGAFAELDRVTREAVARCAAEPRGQRPLLFDRHWLTMLSVLPPSLHGGWLPPPPTVMCHADWRTTLARVSARGETRRNSAPYHQRYCDRFLRLARRHDVPVIDTAASTPEASLRPARRALGV